MGARYVSLWMVAGVALASCQAQEFYPVLPKAFASADNRIEVLGKPLPPNIMLVVDRSGSMTSSVTGTGLACTTDGTTGSTYDPRSTQPCKWNDLKTAFADPATGLLTTSQGLARFGLAAFPGAAGSCSTGAIAVPIGDDPQPLRDQLLNRLIPGGGTPTAASLLAAGRDPALLTSEPNRERFIMLLTDGLPNCNAANAPQCAQCRADVAACTAAGGCRPTDIPNHCDPTPFDGAGCLDDRGMVGAIQQLRVQGVDTFVIGFGRDTAGGDADEVLTRAAIAGGHPRVGAAQQYFQANSLQELNGVLEEILKRFPCTWPLAFKPTDPRLVEVLVDDASERKTTALISGVDWQYASAADDKIEILGDWCTRLQDADPNRYTLHLRSVSEL